MRLLAAMVLGRGRVRHRRECYRLRLAGELPAGEKPGLHHLSGSGEGAASG